MSEVLRLVHTILENWIYLEPLFMNSQEVAKELPVDCKRFKKQDAVRAFQNGSPNSCSNTFYLPIFRKLTAWDIRINPF